MLFLFICHFLTLISGKEFLTCATIRNNKLYTIFQENESYSVKSKVYELKDGSIIDIGKSVKTYQLDNNFVGFEIELLDALDDSQDSQNRLWMRAEFNDNPDEQGIPSYKNWVGYLNLGDMSLRTDSSFINFPTHENFPVDKFTVNIIKNEFGSALYITGGHIQVKDKDEYSFSNSFYKYNFTTKEWADMTYLANRKLKPLILHRSLVIDNRYIVILGGNTKKSKDELERLNGNELERLNGNESEYKFNYFYNLTVFDTFTNNWENVNIKPNVFDTSVVTFQFDSFLAGVYNNKVIVIGRYIREGTNFHVDVTPTIGILDYNSKTWDWSPVYHEDGSKYNSSIYAKNILVYNDQLIMPADNSNPAYDETAPIQVYDMLSQRMKSTLKLSNQSNTTKPGKETNKSMDQDNRLPDYAIVLITLSCITLLIALIYLLYRKNKLKSSYKNGKTQYSGPIREVWSNPDMDNTNNIITLDKKNSSNILDSNGLYLESGNQNTSNTIEFN